MLNKIKQHLSILILGIILIFVTIVLRNQSMIANLQSMLRRKKVEEDINEIKVKLKLTEEEAREKEEKLVALAEKLKDDQKKAKEATEEDIKGYWEEYFDN